MIIGYARTSTLEQEAGFTAQVRDLRAAGVEKVFKEQVSAIGERPRLEAALHTLRKGDQLVVCKLDRLARSVVHLGQILVRITEAGASLRILSIGVDTSTATGKLMLNVIGSVAQFEWGMMLERQREGIAKAAAAGKYKGKKRAFSDKRLQELQAEGLNVAEIAKHLGVTRQAVYKRMQEAA